MRTFEITTHLPASPDRVWREVNRPQLMQFVAAPVIAFQLVTPERLPDRWENRSYLFRLRWHGIIPLGQQVVTVSRPATEDGTRQLRDNGHSWVLKLWDHRISVRPEGTGTRYTDRITIDAGPGTRVVAFLVRRFFLHRQRRWHALVAHGFDYARARGVS